MTAAEVYQTGREEPSHHPTGANHRHPNRYLGPIAPGAQTNAARDRGHRQQDGPNSVGTACERRKLQCRTGDLKTEEIAAPYIAANEGKGRRKG